MKGPRFAATAWSLLYVLAALAFFWPVLTRITQVVVGAPGTEFTDATTMFYPERAFANQELQHGRLPLWNPFILCGQALHGEAQGAIFYPLNMLFAALPAQVSMNLFALVHFAAAGIFFRLYLRACGLRPFGACLGGLVYMFSSAPLSRFFAGHYTIIPFLALVPALMWAWESWRTTRGWKPTAWGGIALALMSLAGYPQLLLYASLYLGWHVIAECLTLRRRQPGSAALAPLGFFLTVVALAAGVGAIQLFPSYTFARESFRLQVAYDTIATFSFAPENLLTLLLPRFFGNLGGETAPYWGRHLLWENWIYIGVVPLALAVLALVRARQPQVIAHGLAIPVFLALALGRHTPLHRLLYDHVPLFSYFRGSSKFSFFIVFSLAALAGIGGDHFLRATDPRGQRSSRIVLGAVLTAFIVFGVALGLILGVDHSTAGSTLSRFVQWRLAQGETYLPYEFFNHPDLGVIWGQSLPQLVRLVALSAVGLLVVIWWPALRRRPWLPAAALCLAVLPDLMQFSTQESVVTPIVANAFGADVLASLRNDPGGPRVLAPELPHNGFLPDRVETPLGYVGNMSRRYNNYLTATNGVERTTSMVETPVLRLVPLSFWPAVSHLILPDQLEPPPDLATPQQRAGGQVLYRLKAVHPRATFARAVSIHDSAAEALAALESGASSRSDAELLETPPGLSPPRFDPPEPGDTVEILESLPMRTTIRTNAAGPRLLVLADSFDLGWRCRLEDGTALRIYPVNVAFRGVRVPQGEHTVTFSYEPQAFVVGAAVSLLTVLALAIGGMRTIRSRGKRPGNRE